ncbi:chaoptin [Phlebotomus argentipes]|uniref:chaoptin n=1 Tax=Phlebotomus argentipes TaxID=94469 RepID=UPI002892A50F|nr:chaoptin [Phlebotomus argentipes]
MAQIAEDTRYSEEFPMAGEVVSNCQSILDGRCEEMDRRRGPHVFIISISMIYWLKSSDAWKLDTRDMQLYTSQDILYSCPLNPMCQCASLPNETSLFQINCNEVSLYKFPVFLHNSVRHIQISQTHLQNVDEETFQGLRLESLKLVNNDIHEILEKSFNSMTHSLITLDMSGNSLHSLCLEALHNIQTLTRLVAQRNHIEELDGNWGSLTESLRSLHISGNSITELSSPYDERKINGTQSLVSAASVSTRTFAKLRKLVWLNLSENRLSYVGVNSLPRSLVTCDFSRNVLTVFPVGAFEHLHDIKIISLKDNLLTSVDGVEFANRVHLEKLDLSFNEITSVPSQMFNGSIRSKAINLENNFLVNLPSAAFRGTSAVHVVLAFNNIASVDSEAFAGLENTLEYLDLERNHLTNLFEGLETLNRMRYLYLTANEINHVSHLPPTLKVLSLSSNNFTSIPTEGLQNCTDLSYLNMGYNKISDLPENGFVSWGSELQTLLLRNNKITMLNYGSFNGLESIKEISLSFNDIHYVHPSAFVNISKTLKILELSFGIYREDIPLEALNPLTELMWLGLDNNNLKLIPDDSLISLKELTFINIAYNRITVLPRTIFVPEIHKNLMDVDASYNVIERLFTNTFDELIMLQFVNLASNNIRHLERHCFHNLPFLTYIDLSYNNLRNVTEAAFAFLPNLLALDLMFNSLTSFSLKAFRHVSNSSTPMRLNISHNEVTLFEGELSSYLYVHTLDASHNFLTDPGVFHNLGQSLRKLHLQNNNISFLTNHAFGDLDVLDCLNLSSNNISTLRRRSFQGLMNLQELDLSDNRIEQLQFEQFGFLKKLRVLNLKGNRLKSLPRDAFVNTRIEFLDMSENFLGLWPANTFSDIGFTLRSIRLDGNQVEYLDATMFSNTNFLLELRLAHNRITVLPDNTFSHLPNLTTLDISFNPLVSTNFKELLLHLPSLRRLSLRSTGLYTLPPMVAQSRLTELDISQNHIQDMSSLRDAPQLRVLHVAYNKIVNLTHFGKYVPQRLRVLDLSGNPIRKVSVHDFAQIRFLDELSIEGVKLPVDAFSLMRNLRVLRATSQYHLGEIISRTRTIRELYVTVLEEHIHERLFERAINATKINLLDVRGPRAKTISPNAFNGFARSQDLTIRLRNTLINDLPPGLFYALKYVPRLKIDISNNLLATLSPDTFYPNASAWDAVGTRSIIGGLDVSGNPLQCDCGLVWLGHWLRRWLRETVQIHLVTKDEQQIMSRQARGSTCLDPISGKKLTFLEIFPEDLLCHASALSSFAPRFSRQSPRHLLGLHTLPALLLIIYFLIL